MARTGGGRPILFGVALLGLGAWFFSGDHANRRYGEDTTQPEQVIDYGPSVAEIIDSQAALGGPPSTVPSVPKGSTDFGATYVAPEYSEPVSGYDHSPLYPSEPTSKRYFDEREAKRQAERKMARRGYDYSFGCTVDCSGHEAGWQYRSETRYPTYGSLDYGNSQSFAEGAQAYERAVKKKNSSDLGRTSSLVTISLLPIIRASRA